MNKTVTLTNGDVITEGDRVKSINGFYGGMKYEVYMDTKGLAIRTLNLTDFPSQYYVKDVKDKIRKI